MMKKIPLSPLDLGMLIAFVVVGLLGGSLWYFYLSPQLQASIDDVTSAKSDFDRFSVTQGIVVSKTNEKTLQDNIALLNSRLDPLIENTFVAKGNKFPDIILLDPVAWKHELDDLVQRLTAEAKLHAIGLPPNFYFGFSRYVSQNPGDDQTIVLKKQLLGMEQIVEILIGAQVKSITSIQRTYEEDGHASSSPGGDSDHLAGFSSTGGDDVYTAYPFEADFEANTASLRKVMTDLMNSPYVMVIRSVSVQNEQPLSPQLTVLAQIAGTSGTPSVVGSSPGEVSIASKVPPQFLFSENLLRIKLRIDLIEWKVPPSVVPPPAMKPGNLSPSLRGTP